ncbi:MAG: hypothetical protein GX640_22345, partial [Fibrobacter sp.]|nr:hypothetical protein [Fibrobacter sp.]
MKQHEQIIILVAALNHVMQGIPPAEIKGFKYGLISYIEQQAPYIIRKIETGEFNEEIKEDIVRLAREYPSQVRDGGDE